MNEGEQLLVETLRGTLSPYEAERNAAAASLEHLERVPACAGVLLRLACTGAVDAAVRQAAACALKNFVAAQWSSGVLSAAEQAELRRTIVPSVVGADPVVRGLLAEALRCVARGTTLDAWPQLLPELVQALSSPRPHEIAGALAALRALVQNYEHSKLYTETPRLPPTKKKQNTSEAHMFSLHITAKQRSVKNWIRLSGPRSLRWNGCWTR